MDPALQLFVASAPGVEPLLAAELSALGLDGEVTAGGVQLSSELAGLYRVLLHSRLALSLRVRLGQLRATHFSELEKRLRALPFGELLPPGATAEVRATARRCRLYHTGALVERVQRALREALGEPGDAGTGWKLHVRGEADRFTLSLDLCGEALHRRGYRTRTGKAPLREDLAAALLTVAGYDGTQALCDPLCGSGTLAIEAALLGSGRAPGGRRAFAVEASPIHDPALWADEKRRVEASRHALAAAIVASDRDAGAIEAACDNASRAGLGPDAPTFARLALGRVELPDPGPGGGLIVTNPPYGRRIGRSDRLRDLYAALGALRRRAPDGYRLALVTSDAGLARATEVPLRSALMTDAGGIKVRLYVEDPA